MSASAGCRGFEERLAAELDALLSAPLAELGHGAGCASCGALLERLRENQLLFGRLVRPAPDEGFVARLSTPPPDFAARREAEAVLALLAPGTLASPEPSTELLSRLAFLPTRARAARSTPSAPRGRLARLFADWRVTVAVVYAVLFLVIGALRVDPLSVARGAASDLTSTGERVLGEARVAAVRRLEGNPLTRRFDYRVYRAVAASRARASAYAQLLFEKVTGTRTDDSAAASTAPRRARRPAREPARSVLRSFTRTPTERVQRT